jgi:hypothetical protein
MAKGVVQNNPPMKPSRANCHIGSDPDAPNDAANTGITKVRHAMNRSIIAFLKVDLVTIAISIAANPGDAREIINSHPEKTLSVVRA